LRLGAEIPGRQAAGIEQRRVSFIGAGAHVLHFTVGHIQCVGEFTAIVAHGVGGITEKLRGHIHIAEAAVKRRIARYIQGEHGSSRIHDMHHLGVPRVVVAAVLRNEDPLDDVGLVAAVPVVEVIDLEGHVDGTVAIVDGVGQCVHGIRRRRAGYDGVSRDVHQGRRRLVVHHDDLHEAVPDVAAFVNGGIGQDVVVVATARHDAVFDEHGVDGAVVRYIDDAGIDQCLERRFEATGPLIAFDHHDLQAHHHGRLVFELVDQTRRGSHISAFILCPPRLGEGAAIAVGGLDLGHAFVGQGRETGHGTIVRDRHPIGLGKLRKADHVDVVGHP